MVVQRVTRRLSVALVSCIGLNAAASPAVGAVGAIPNAMLDNHRGGTGLYVSAQGGGARLSRAKDTGQKLLSEGIDDPEIETFLGKVPFGFSSEEKGSLGGRLALGYALRRGDLSYGAELGFMKHQNNRYGYAISALNVVFIPVTLSISDKVTKRGSLADLLVVGRYYPADRFNVIGKAGAAYVYQSLRESYEWTVDAEVEDEDEGMVVLHKSDAHAVTSHWHRLCPEVQLGLGYDLSKNLSINATYMHVFASNAHLKAVNPLDAALVGLELYWA